WRADADRETGCRRGNAEQIAVQRSDLEGVRPLAFAGDGYLALRSLLYRQHMPRFVTIRTQHSIQKTHLAVHANPGKLECDLRRAIRQIIRDRGCLGSVLGGLKGAAVHFDGYLSERNRSVRYMAHHAAAGGDPDSPLAIFVD